MREFNLSLRYYDRFHWCLAELLMLFQSVESDLDDYIMQILFLGFYVMARFFLQILEINAFQHLM